MTAVPPRHWPPEPPQALIDRISPYLDGLGPRVHPFPREVIDGLVQIGGGFSHEATDNQIRHVIGEIVDRISGRRVLGHRILCLYDIQYDEDRVRVDVWVLP